MKYLKWIVKKGTRKTVWIWMVSVISGTVAFLWLLGFWAYSTWNYFVNNIFPTQTDNLIVILVVFYLCIPAWLGYYFSDRKLFYYEFMKNPDNW